MVTPQAALYRRWRAQAGIQTPATLTAFVAGVLRDCLHSDDERIAANAAAVCALAALSAFENATAPMDYDAALAVLEEIKLHWVDGR